MLRVRIESNGKVYDTESAELLFAGQRQRGSRLIPAAYFQEESEGGIIHFTVELGDVSEDPQVVLDTSRITLVPQEQRWVPREDGSEVGEKLKVLFKG